MLMLELVTHARALTNGMVAGKDLEPFLAPSNNFNQLTSAETIAMHSF